MGTPFDQPDIRITDLLQSDGPALRKARACDGWVSIKELDETGAPHYRPLEVIRIRDRPTDTAARACFPSRRTPRGTRTRSLRYRAMGQVRVSTPTSDQHAHAPVPIAPDANPRQALEAIFDGVAKLASSPACLWCTWVAAAAEFPEPDHPGHGVAIAHKRAVIEHLRGLADEAGARDPEALAEELLLRMNGAWSAARDFGPGSHAGRVDDAARALIEAHVA